MKIHRRIALILAVLFTASVLVSTASAASASAQSALNIMGDQNNICVVLGLPDDSQPDFVTELVKQSQWRKGFTQIRILRLKMHRRHGGNVQSASSWDPFSNFCSPPLRFQNPTRQSTWITLGIHRPRICEKPTKDDQP